MNVHTLSTRSENNPADQNERLTRIHARRLRIEVQNAKNEAQKRNENCVETKQLGHGEHQVESSVNHLHDLKIASINQITNIRVRADDLHAKRRIEEANRLRTRHLRIHQETAESTAKNGSIEVKWADLVEIKLPQELQDELESLNTACEDIIISKNRVILEFQKELRKKDEDYVKALRVQSEDLEQIIARTGQQYTELQEEYELELSYMEQAFMKERSELVKANRAEIDVLFDARREMEIGYLEMKQARDEKNVQEIEALRVRDAEEYNGLKIKLETNMQTLEQQLEDMRAAYQLNTEKLEYNYRVLTERDMENSATLSQLKRKLTRFKDTLSTLRAKYNQSETRDRQNNQQLTEDFRRTTKQYRDLQKKHAHFLVIEGTRYKEVWNMHKQVITTKLEKLLKASQVIHEQQLGLTWIPPSRSIDCLSSDVRLKVASGGVEPEDNLLQLSEDVVDAVESTDWKEKHSMNGIPKMLSQMKTVYLYKLIASEFGFLISPSVDQSLESRPKGEADLVRAEHIMKTLGFDSEKGIEMLMGAVFSDPYSNNASDVEGHEPCDHEEWDLKIPENDVLRVIKQLAEAQKTEFSQSPRHIDSTDVKAYDSPKASHSEPQITARQFWEKTLNVVPPRTIRVFQIFENVLTAYNLHLSQRRDLHQQISKLGQENFRLKNMLRQQLNFPINEELLISPTQYRSNNDDCS
uniref:Uncharacterized protein AlNc14C82G5332 n=1 Tax=Albugo laibachii Nc14 TaxID=890382 RepID=F0WFE3_9STRA|nr:conserved hypothetical protein [Albugo laibachii Nc14]|eukprot:CCA19925.1 conserved hypothetical protein [Albugo laibachii Nc14]